MMDYKKEVQRTRKLKEKCKKQGDLKSAAEYANALGNLHSESGDYQSAIDEHEFELMACQSLKDRTGEAIANRKLGECYMELMELDTALTYVEKYVSIAKSLTDKIELQRAYVTLGRLHLTESGSLIPKTKKRRQSEKNAESAFMRALELCEHIRSKLQSTEYHDMKARSLLNLGLLASLRNEEKESTSNIKNAVAIARKHGLSETLVRCLYHLAEVDTKFKHFTDAACLLDDALEHTSKVNFQLKLDIIKLQAQIAAEIGHVGDGLDRLKTIMRKHTQSECQEMRPTAVKLHKIVSGKNRLPLVNDEEKSKIYEKLADYCCALGANYRAIQFYEKALEIMNQLKIEHIKLTPILSSLAQTHQDVREYDKAISYYCQEVKIQKQLKKFDQAAKSLLNIASCMEMQNSSWEVVKKCYDQAETHAMNANDPKLQVMVLRNYGETMKCYGFTDEYNECRTKIEAIKCEYGFTTESQEDEQSESDGSDGGFELSDDSDEEGEAEIVRLTRNKPYKVLKNDVGETKLHQAVIKGKLDVAINLLKQGHPVNVRDHAGWLPLHEAACHNKVDIAKVLIKYGSDINDRGGVECCGCTPLHEACKWGCVDMMQLLVESGSNVIAKEDKNRYPLDLLLEYRENEHDDLDEEQRRHLDEVEEMIRTRMIMKGIKPKTAPFKELKASKDDVEELPVVKPPVRAEAAREECISPFPESESSPSVSVPLSPEQSAIDMYRSAVANVRKSAKRVSAPRPSTDRSRIVESALNDPDSDINIAVSNDWLVDDYVNSPQKKKQKTTEKRKTSQVSQRSKKSLHGAHNSNKEMSDASQLDPASFSPDTGSPKRSLTPVSSHEPTVQYSSERVVCRSPSPANSHLSRTPSPLPRSPVSSKDARNIKLTDQDSQHDHISSSEEQDTGAVQGCSQILIQPAFEEGRTNSDKGGYRSNEDETDVPSADLADPGDPDDGNNALPCADGLQSSQKSLFSQETAKAIVDLCSRHQGDELPVGFSELEQVFQSPKTNKSNYCNDVDAQLSPALSAIKLLNDNNHSTADESKKRKCRRDIKESMLDDIIGNKENPSKNSKAPPTSTPLRKTLGPLTSKAKQLKESPKLLQQACLKIDETADSGFPTEVQMLNASTSSGKALKEVSVNSTLLQNTVSSQSSKNAFESGSNSSKKCLRILVQWKNRTLLIPIANTETCTIDWLVEEFVRRISKSRASISVTVNPADMVLTRASEGAELFSEDLVSDVLTDNEKVVAVSVNDLSF